MPHPGTPGTFFRVLEPTVFQSQDTAGGATQKLHVDPCFCGADGRGCLPDISDLVCAYNPASAINACLKGFAAIEINAEGLFCYRSSVSGACSQASMYSGMLSA